jgi:thiol:disulfide interchange protein DsbD
VDPNSFSINWQIKPGYFLYKDRIKLTEQSEKISTVGDISFPKASNRIDPQGHSYDIYRNSLVLQVPILNEKPGETLINLHYQGCSDDGFCYPPVNESIRLTVDVNLALIGASLEKAEIEKQSSVANPVEKLFAEENWMIIILSFLGFGLLLSFTPCILPMVPVLSGIIIGHGENISTRKAFLLSLSYVLSMSITYAAVGAMVALVGNNLQILMQTPWVIVLFSLLFVILALSMFGFFDLKLPLSWQMALAKVSRRQGHGHYLGAAIMGSLSTLILSPCVTAPLIGALGYIAQTGNILLGCLTLFFLGLGMGIPLLLIGTSAGKWLPKTGVWMNTIKNLFGILLLSVSIYLLNRIISPLWIMLLWSSLFIFSGIYFGALLSAQTKHEKFCQGIGIIMFGYGLLILVGTSMGSTNPFKPLEIFSKNQAAELVHTKIKTLAEIQKALADTSGKPIILDFYADWCTSCKIMENEVFSKIDVQKALQNFRMLQVDVTDQNVENQKIMRHFEIIAPPTFVFFNQYGKEITELRMVGEASTQEVLKHLDKVSDKN